MKGAMLLLALLIHLESSLANNTERGLFLAGLLNPRFPVTESCQILSKVDRPAFSFVYKAFGNKHSNLQKLITCLKDSGIKDITAVVYADCGPCRQPRRPKGLFKLIQPSLDIPGINRQLQNNNKKVIDSFANYYASIKELLVQQEGVRYIFSEALEDNYSVRAFSKLRSLSRGIFIDRNDLTLLRNPLTGSSRGGGKLEKHGYGMDVLRELRRGDILNGDGDLFCFKGERCPSQAKSESEIKHLIAEAGKRGVIVLLFRPEIQGLPAFIPSNKVSLRGPFERVYKFPQKDRLIYLLK